MQSKKVTPTGTPIKTDFIRKGIFISNEKMLITMYFGGANGLIINTHTKAQKYK